MRIRDEGLVRRPMVLMIELPGSSEGLQHRGL